MRKCLWSFKTKHFTISWTIEDDALDTAGMAKSLARKCRSKVDSGEWTCFLSEITVTHTKTGAVLGEAYLGNSIYEDPTEFRDHFGMNKKGYGSYFSQMVRDAVAEARKNFPTLQNSISGVVMRNLRVGDSSLKEATI